MPNPSPVPQPEHGARVAIACRPGQRAGEAASAFIAQLGLEPVMLPAPDTADGAFIERLESLGALDFAVFLLSADDPGATPSVLLEIGFLVGALGRRRLCCILEGKPATVPYLDFVARHTMDEAGLWRLLLAREMKQAGLDIDMNRAL